MVKVDESTRILQQTNGQCDSSMTEMLCCAELMMNEEQEPRHTFLL